MASKTFVFTYYSKTGGGPVQDHVQANDSVQARKIVETRPDFKSWQFQPREVRK